MPKPPSRMLRPADAEGRRTAVLRRLFVAARYTIVLIIAGAFTTAATPATNPTTGPTTAPAALPAGPGGIPGDVVEALRSLKSLNADARAKAYATLADKGDARILPVINSFYLGQLHLRDDKGAAVKTGTTLAMYGAGVERPGGKEFPVLNALTGEPITGADGKPVAESGKMNLASAFTRPLNAIQQKPVLELRAFLSLLHPDPEVRIASIRDGGERAARVFPDPGDEDQLRFAMRRYADIVGKAGPLTPEDAKATEAGPKLLAAFEVAYAEKPKGMFDAAPGKDTVSDVARQLEPIVAAARLLKGADGKMLWPAPPEHPFEPRIVALSALSDITTKYRERVDGLEKALEDLPRTAEALKKQLAADPNGAFAPNYREAIAQMDAVLGDDATRLTAVPALGEFATERSANVLRKLQVAAARAGDAKLRAAIEPALAKADSYQRKVRLAQYTFAGFSTGSIYVLLALGLAVIFGLMGVINMAHGEFMMVGAFTTLVVATWFKNHLPGAYDWFPIVAVPAAFLVSGLFGLLTEFLVIRHLYGRTTETLLATIGVGLILVQLARVQFGDNVSYNAPRWMQGSTEVVADLNLNRARLWTIAYCALCVSVVYLIVNKTKLGLLLRATTQNRKMAAALGVPTRTVDAMTFAFGAGLAGMAGVVVPMIDKINPSMGQDYVVSSFMVVVVGGVGKLAGAIIAGIGLGSIGNYLEPLLGSIPAFAKTSSVLGKVLVLAAIVMFLQWRPSGLFPPKGRVADA